MLGIKYQAKQYNEYRQLFRIKINNIIKTASNWKRIRLKHDTIKKEVADTLLAYQLAYWTSVQC